MFIKRSVFRNLPSIPFNIKSYHLLRFIHMNYLYYMYPCMCLRARIHRNISDGISLYVPRRALFRAALIEKCHGMSEIGKLIHIFSIHARTRARARARQCVISRIAAVLSFRMPNARSTTLCFLACLATPRDEERWRMPQGSRMQG